MTMPGSPPRLFSIAFGLAGLHFAFGETHMTHEELIAIAREEAKGFKDPDGCCPTIEQLPKTRVRDAVVVYFESDEHDGKIEVFLERASGQLITATLIPHKPKPAK